MLCGAVRESLTKLTSGSESHLLFSPTPRRLTITPSGEISFSPDAFNSFVQALKGKQRDRIRRCGACFKFYWAYRKDLTGCSDKCRDILYHKKKRQPRNKTAERERRDRVKQSRLAKDSPEIGPR
jgi:hypothetical protein